ncbi:anti-phage deoxyguanosine triphosphatase [Novosphingobium sp. JCM 18896]|uniref:anti-phage deoxyguanosine triphosphatase n=1 Tax=Novosphingobium sp. JCM 18896 TaxID=2989731 RepID=UPI0029CA8B04|nr:anti-phage deoxyguanosine triphosphatase [Novosphingobium sp. JCM 18896]
MSWLERRTPETRKPYDARSEGDIDYGRVVHSASFRRLQGKTQILNLGDSDFYRTRLTHSLEVAQIAGGIVKQLRFNYPDHPALASLPEHSLIQAIACTHDLGHPPFGHGGEVALNYCMRADGGFEGNGQTLRILSRLEKFSREAGSNLTRETMMGVLKYPIAYDLAANPAIKPKMLEETSGTPLLDREASKPPKCYLGTEDDVVDWILQPLSRGDRDLFQGFEAKKGKHHRAQHKSLACSIMDLADDISYGVHDLEDALALRLIEPNDFRRHVPPDKCKGILDYLAVQYAAWGEYGNDVYEGFVERLFGGGDRRKHQINRVLNYIIPSVRFDEHTEFEEPRLRYRAGLPGPVKTFVDAMKDFIYEMVIRSPSVQHLELKGQMMVIAVFEVMKSDPKSFLPTDIYAKLDSGEKPARVICDYVSGMTDNHLLRTYERLFSPRLGSVFDRL